jgi:hypothetical protein
MDIHKMAKRMYELSYGKFSKTQKFKTQKIHEIEEWLEIQDLDENVTPESLQPSWEYNEYSPLDDEDAYRKQEDENKYW